MITNPNNPLGRTYPRETLLAVAHFARDNGLHLLVNEIYAQSVYQNDGAFCEDRARETARLTGFSEWPEAPPFVSALSIDFEREVPGFDMGRLHGELPSGSRGVVRPVKSTRCTVQEKCRARLTR